MFCAVTASVLFSPQGYPGVDGEQGAEGQKVSVMRKRRLLQARNLLPRSNLKTMEFQEQKKICPRKNKF